MQVAPMSAPRPPVPDAVAKSNVVSPDGQAKSSNHVVKNTETKPKPAAEPLRSSVEKNTPPNNPRPVPPGQPVLPKDPNLLPTTYARRLAATLMTTHNEKIFRMSADCFQAAQRMKFSERARAIAELRAWARQNPETAKTFCTANPFFPYADLIRLHDRLRQR
jgi:hypothetical protein